MCWCVIPATLFMVGLLEEKVSINSSFIVRMNILIKLEFINIQDKRERHTDGGVDMEGKELTFYSASPTDNAVEERRRKGLPTPDDRTFLSRRYT